MAISGAQTPGQRRRKDARPTEILDAGLAEFAERGFAATRLDDVARRANISKGTIYLYFDSKEALFEAALRDRIVPVIADSQADLAGFGGTTEEMLARVLNRFYDRITGPDVVLMKVMISEGQRSPDLVRLHYDTVLTPGLNLFRAIIARGIARGEVRDGPAAHEPRLVIAPAIMMAVWKLLFEPHEPIDRAAFVSAHLDLLRHGLLRPAGPGGKAG